MQDAAAIEAERTLNMDALIRAKKERLAVKSAALERFAEDRQTGASGRNGEGAGPAAKRAAPLSASEVQASKTKRAMDAAVAEKVRTRRI